MTPYILPEPTYSNPNAGCYFDGFTADQMHAAFAAGAASRDGEIAEARALNERYLTKVTEMHQDRDALLLAASKAYYLLRARISSPFSITGQEEEVLRALREVGANTWS